MYKLLVLSEEENLFSEVEENVQHNDSLEVRTFRHSLEMINYFLSHYASLIILDVDLLKSELLEMIQVLKSIHGEVRIILFLSPENMPLCSSAISLGILSYQIKPVSPETVMDIISSVLQIPIDH
jgi:DNA-binding NtrC family response regulator